MSEGVNSSFIGRLLGPIDANIQGAGAHVAKKPEEDIFNAKERNVDLSSVSAFCATTA